MPNMMRGMRGAPAKLRHVGATKQPYFSNQASLREWDVRSQFALDRVIAVFFKAGYPVILTSGYRSELYGDDFSLHPYGFAFDVDTDHDLPQPEWERLAQLVKNEIGPDYDVIAHSKDGWHLHIEYDPKNDTEWAEFKADLKEQWAKAREPEEQVVQVNKSVEGGWHVNKLVEGGWDSK